MNAEDMIKMLKHSDEGLPEHVAQVRGQLPMGLIKQSLDAGSVLPPVLEGCKIVILGCASPASVFVAAKLAGGQGKVTLVEPDAVKLAVAQEQHGYITELWGFANIEFVQAELNELDFIADDSIDVVVSNCAISGAPNKEHIFAQIYRILTTGGELFFRDLFTDRRPTEAFKKEAAQKSSTIAGALYIEDQRRMLNEAGWPNLRYFEFSAKLTLPSAQLRRFSQDVRFFTATIRAFKVPGLLTDICEEYGQTVIYNGGIPGMEGGFVFDRKHTYGADQVCTVCNNPAAVLSTSRYREFFTVDGDRSHHLGACCGGILKGVDLEHGTAPGSSCCCSSSGCCGDGGKEASDGSSCCCGDDDCCSDTDGSCCSDSSCCSDGGNGGSSCCCGDGEWQSNGCCDPNAINDDPNQGRKEVVTVDYLYLDQSICDRCQGTDARVAKAVELVRPIMDMAGYNIVMNKVEIENEYLADRFEFLSSPTVRVNGVDICPEVIENECDCCRELSSYDVYCRQFSFNGKLYEVPPTAYVVKRLLEIVFHGEKPAYEDYVMPENIRGFLREKYDQSNARPAAAKSEGGCSCC